MTWTVLFTALMIFCLRLIDVSLGTIRLLMIGRGQMTPKYEDIYIKEYTSVLAPAGGLEAYFHLCDHERPHQNLGCSTLSPPGRGR